MTSRVNEILDTMRAAHDQLATTVTHITTEQATGPAYPSEWTVAQTLSHLGSGAEIFGALIKAASAGEPMPGVEHFHQVWDVWSAKAPEAQAADAVTSNADFIDSVAALSPEVRDRLRMDLFGVERDLADVLGMRLSEQVVHSWDALVALDPSATLFTGAVPYLLDRVGDVARRGKPVDQAQRIALTTDDPERHLQLSIGPDGPSISEGADHGTKATLHLSAEALIRLVYGRLDAAHTPPVQTEGVDLDLLRKSFPGF